MNSEPVNPWGSCFDSAGRVFLLNEIWPEDARLCHGIGIANKPGEEGVVMAHAWIEFEMPDYTGYTGRAALDPIWMVAQEAEVYRRNFQVSKVVEYTREEFRQLWIEHNYPGPWDPEIKAQTKEGKAECLASAPAV